MSRSNEDPKNKIEIVCMGIGIEKEKEVVVSGSGKAPTNVELSITKPENCTLENDGTLRGEDGKPVTSEIINVANVKENRKIRKSMTSKDIEIGE